MAHGCRKVSSGFPRPGKSHQPHGLWCIRRAGKRHRGPHSYFRDVLDKEGGHSEARVLGVNVENERFSLGIKQLTPDPWKVIAERYPAGSKVKGHVTSVPDFGVFVRIDEGVEGLIHVSQLSVERIDKPSSLYKVGDEVEAEVINIDVNERKIGLSIRALRKTEERQEMENYLKREKEGGRFSFESLLNDELRLDRDEEGQTNRKGKGGNP